MLPLDNWARKRSLGLSLKKKGLAIEKAHLRKEGKSRFLRRTVLSQGCGDTPAGGEKGGRGLPSFKKKKRGGGKFPRKIRSSSFRGAYFCAFEGEAWLSR